MRFVEPFRGPSVVEISVDLEDGTSGWMFRCPRCHEDVEARTRQGAVDELAHHMNTRHYSPPRGNA